MKRINVCGKVPATNPTFNQMYPMGTPERAAVEAKMEAVTGIEFLVVCRRFDAEMLAMAEAEKQAAIAKKQAALDAATKKAQG